MLQILTKLNLPEKNLQTKNTTDIGHPGGIKTLTPLTLTEKNKSQDILKLAVKRMLPDGPLAKKQMTKLKFIRV